MQNLLAKIFKRAKGHILPFLGLLAIVLTLFFTNYTPGTYLTGWDNLHPEFNFGLNLNRSIFAVWQEYQGLGLLGGMAHASDFVHQVELLIASVILKPDLLRYFYHFSMLFLGMAGTYLIIRKFLYGIDNRTKTLSAVAAGLFSVGPNEKIRILAASAAGIFYGLNLGTIQYFYVPFEPYSTFFGFFPILLYSLFTYFERPNRKNLIILAVINLLATPLAYVQTVFLVYFICATLVTAVFAFASNGQSKRLHMKHGFIALSSILIINAFWLLPNLYFTATNVSVTQNAMQNKMATEKFFQMNKNRGTIIDLALLKEFYYDFTDLNDKTGTFDYLIKPWRNFTSQPLYIVLGLTFFAVAVFGLITKNAYRKYLLGLTALSVIVFLSDTIIISQIGSILRITPLLSQIFRNPFTKFIVPLIFVYAVGLGLGIAQISLLISKYLNKLVLPLIFIVLILISVFPAFTGKFISPQMRQTIPKEYFDVFSYFKTQDPDARIMNLPQGSYWGWDYYSWGYHGSGFLWYGIGQPIMDRAFDVWSTPLENYYWQLSYALKRRDMDLFNQILNKYNIRFILFDNNVSFSDNKNALKADLNQEKLLTDNPILESPVSFGEIKIYKTKLADKSVKNLSFYDNLPPANASGPQYKDNSFASFGNYVSNSTQNNYPFGSLFTGRFQNELNFSVLEDKDSFTLKTKVKKGSYDLFLPPFFGKERQLSSEMFAKRDGNTLVLRFILLKPELTINNREIKTDSLYQDVVLELPKNAQNIIVDVNNASYFPLSNLSSAFVSIGKTYLFNENTANSIQVYSADQTALFSLPADEFSQANICGGKDPNANFSSKTQGSALTLAAKNTAICAPHTLTLPTTNTLLKASFEYKSSTDEFPQYCIYSEDSRKCLNKKDAIFKGYSNDYAKFEEYFENNNKTDTNVFQAILDASRDEDKNSEKSISYRNINIVSYPYIAGSTIFFTTLNDSSYYVPVTTDRDSEMAISFAKIDSVFSYPNAISNHAFKLNSLNYDTLNNGLSQKDFASGNPSFVRLTSQNASSYLLINGALLSPGTGYITSVKSRTVAGLPPTVNIFTNKDSRSYTYTYTQKSRDFASNYFILPPLYEFDQGISILLGASSYNRDKTINDISNVSFYAIPYNYTTSISLSPRSMPNLGNAITPQSQNKPDKSAIYLYETDVPVGAGMVVLSQAYDAGWKAYKVNDVNKLSLALPFLFGKQTGKHIMVNSWENGWLLGDFQPNSKLIIVYLPQYLEYIGFVLLLGLFIYLAFPLRLKHK